MWGYDFDSATFKRVAEDLEQNINRRAIPSAFREIKYYR